MEAQHSTGINLEARRSFKRTLERIKSQVSIEDYLASQGVNLTRNRAQCIVHGGENPHSFSVDPEKQRWHCFACLQGGDLLDLVELNELHADKWTALVSLAQRFNIELPSRSDIWRHWQDQKAKRAHTIVSKLADLYQRRYYQLFFADTIATIEDEAERKAEAKRCFEGLRFLAWGCARDRVKSYAGRQYRFRKWEEVG